jgi:hypothetical protein
MLESMEEIEVNSNSHTSNPKMGYTMEHDHMKNDDLLDGTIGIKQVTSLDMDNVESTYYNMLLTEIKGVSISSFDNSKTSVTGQVSLNETVSNIALDLDEVLVKSELYNNYSNSSEIENVTVANVDDGGDNDNDDDYVSEVSELSDEHSTWMMSYPLNPLDIFSFPGLVPSTPSKRASISRNKQKSFPKSKLKSIVSKKSLDAPSTNQTTNNTDSNKVFEFDFRVGFRNVTVRKYSYILGDNPACSCGPSLSISWEHHQEEFYSVDDFEYRRDDLYTRELIDLALSAKTRLNIVRNVGYTNDEIKAAITEIHTIRAHRMATAKKNLVEKTGKVFSTVKLKVNKIIRNMKSDKGKSHIQFAVGNQAA